MTIAPEVLAEVRLELSRVPHRGRTAATKRIAARLGVSASTLYRKLSDGRVRRRRRPTRPEYRAWVAVATTIAHETRPALALETAIEIGLASGDLEPAAADMPLSTAHRIMRELGFRDRRPHRRMAADWPFQAVLVDGSSSPHLIADRSDDDGWTVRMWRGHGPAGGYKNKPLPAHRQRVWLYAAWDMCTGCQTARYVVAAGENAFDATEFLVEQFSGDPGPMRGVPTHLWSDRGPLFNTGAARRVLAGLGVEVKSADQGKKERMGGVERTHRTRWGGFERALFLAGREEWTLAEINERLEEFNRRQNEGRPARRLVGGKALTRAVAWDVLMNERPEDMPLEAMPPNAMETYCHEARRTVDVAGVIRWDNREYEVDREHVGGLIGRRVTVRRAPGGDRLTVERAGFRTTATPLVEPEYGRIRTFRTPVERLLAEAPKPAAADIFGQPAPRPKVLAMPGVTAPAKPLPDPLATTDRYADVEEAFRALQRKCSAPIDPAARQAIARHLEEHELARAAVDRLARMLDELDAPRAQEARP